MYPNRVESLAFLITEHSCLKSQFRKNNVVFRNTQRNHTYTALKLHRKSGELQIFRNTFRNQRHIAQRSGNNRFALMSNEHPLNYHSGTESKRIHDDIQVSPCFAVVRKIISSSKYTGFRR